MKRLSSRLNNSRVSRRHNSSKVSSSLSSCMKRLSSNLMKRKHQLGHIQKLPLINER
jgi:hypothetical protein